MPGTDTFARLIDLLDRGTARGILDQFKKVWNGAKDGLRVFSFYETKHRAGTVGVTQAAKVATEWGGMGSDGFQGCQPQADATLAPGAVPAGLTPGQSYRVHANAIIKDTSQSAFSGAHSDIERPEIAALAIAAATA